MIGVWAPEFTSDDVEVAKTLRRKPVKAKPPKANGHETIAYHGIGVIGRLLANDGLLGDEVEPGVWSIKCPLHGQHTKGEPFDGSVRYYSPTSLGHYLGTIDCLHTSQGHHHKSSQDWLACWSQAQIDAAREAEGLPAFRQPKPTVRKTNGAVQPIGFEEIEPAKDDPSGPDGVAVPDQKPRVVLSVNIEAMARACVPVLPSCGIYKGTDKLLRIVNISQDEAEHRKLANYAGTPVIRPVELPYLKSRLSSAIDWVKRKAVRGEFHDSPAKPDNDAVAAVLTLGDYPGVNYLVGVKTSPFFRPDGTVCTKPGYDAQTGFFFAPAMPVPDIPSAPTLADAKRAAVDLLEPFIDFPHATPADKWVPIAAILTILLRPAIDGPVPGFTTDANRARVGKGLQSACIAKISTGRDWSSASWSDDKEEVRKILDGWALDGAELVGFDDIEPHHEFNNPTLRSYLTKTTPDVRRLGSSGQIKCIWTAVILGNGNRMRITREMAARVLRSRIESTDVHPEQRTQFKHSPLLPWVTANQQRLLRAALIIIRAWFVANRPLLNKATLGSFEAWCQTVPQIIQWVADIDILQCVPSNCEVGEDEAARVRLVEALRACPPGRTASQLFDNDEFMSAIREDLKSKNVTSSTVGLLLRANRRQAVELEDGHFWIDVVGTHGHSSRWEVVRVPDKREADGTRHGADGEGGEDTSTPLRVKKLVKEPNNAGATTPNDPHHPHQQSLAGEDPDEEPGLFDDLLN